MSAEELDLRDIMDGFKPLIDKLIEERLNEGDIIKVSDVIVTACTVSVVTGHTLGDDPLDTFNIKNKRGIIYPNESMVTVFSRGKGSTNSWVD